MHQLSKLELAWAAGFFDGEGTSFCHVPKSGGTRSLQFSISQVELQPLERFQAAIGGLGNIHWRGKIYCLRAYGPYAHEAIQKLWPYLSTPKKDQALKALLDYAFRAINNRGGLKYCQRGHRFSKRNTYLAPKRGRECITCRKLRRQGSLPKSRRILAIERSVGIRKYESPPPNENIKTAHQAVAWTFGLDTEKYQPSVET